MPDWSMRSLVMSILAPMAAAAMMTKEMMTTALTLSV